MGDVLAYVAFALDPITRAQRAEQAREAVRNEYTDKQRGFVDFVLAQYTKEGVWELGSEKLAPLLRLKYKAIADATVEIGTPEQIRSLFVGSSTFSMSQASPRETDPIPDASPASGACACGVEGGRDHT